MSAPIAHTAPAPAAIRGKPSLGTDPNTLGVGDSFTVAVTLSERRSTRVISVVMLTPLWKWPFPTQTAPPPTARSVGRGPALNRLTAFVSRSIRATVSASLSSTHTAPAPTATLLGAAVASMNGPAPPSAWSATTPLPGGTASAPPRVTSASVAAMTSTTGTAAIHLRTCRGSPARTASISAAQLG